jgi:hypothetical protein
MTETERAVWAAAYAVAFAEDLSRSQVRKKAQGAHVDPEYFRGALCAHAADLAVAAMPKERR